MEYNRILRSTVIEEGQKDCSYGIQKIAPWGVPAPIAQTLRPPLGSLIGNVTAM